MRFIVSFLLLALFVIFTKASPVAEDETQQKQIIQAQAENLLTVDGQGHENESERIARQFGFGGYGGYRGGYGGYRGGYGGYGGYRGGYGGYRGGYGGYRGGYGGYRGGYGYYG